MGNRVLHCLSQRPSRTGSGITLASIVEHAAARGWEQWAVVGTPGSDPAPEVGVLSPSRILPLRFETQELPFPVPGMSDVMPYASTRFSAMDEAQLGTYESAWRTHLRRALDEAQPDVIHTHHVWLMSALLKEVAPDIPVVNHCHATGLRQMSLCPHLTESVRAGCARNDRFVVLHQEHQHHLATALGVSEARIDVVGAGYRDDVFSPPPTPAASNELLYVGKFSIAKGLPYLLDACNRLWEQNPSLRLHVAGSGSGCEAKLLEQRMAFLAPRVVLHGQLDQPQLAELMRGCAVCVLPSFYEGVPLVLIEALACGCRLVSTALPGVLEQIVPAVRDAIELVPLPPLAGVDRPLESAVPAFVSEVAMALERALTQPPMTEIEDALLAPFSWGSVFERIETAWSKARTNR